MLSLDPLLFLLNEKQLVIPFELVLQDQFQLLRFDHHRFRAGVRAGTLLGGQGLVVWMVTDLWKQKKSMKILIFSSNLCENN